MKLTKHCRDRMVERGISKTVLSLIEVAGIWKTGTDKVIVSGSEAAMMEKELRSFLKVLEKAKRRGGVTVVEVGGKFLTTYYNDSYKRKFYVKAQGDYHAI